MTDEFYMRRAIELAKKGRGWTNPNPMVGAVIVKNGSIIGEGYHEKCGELHAERNAIASLTESAEGATLYVTLEPCPMCAGAIINSRIRRVVYGAADTKAGCCGSVTDLFAMPFNHHPVVEQGLRAEEAQELLQAFFKDLRARLSVSVRARLAARPKWKPPV